MAHGELRGKQREGVAAPCVSLGMRRRTSWARVCCLGKGYAAKESDGEATAVDDGAGGVARGGAMGARVAGARCQGGAGWRKTGGAEGSFGRGTAHGRRPETGAVPDVRRRANAVRKRE